MDDHIVRRSAGRTALSSETEPEEARPKLPDKAELVYRDTSDSHDPDEDRHRLEATRHHRKRAARQVFSTAIIVFVAAAALPAWRLLYSVTAEERQAIGPLFGVTLPISPLIAIGLAVAAVVGLGIYVFSLWWYRRERLHDWAKNAAQADARQPERSADGYMQIFRLYARTKRRAFFTIAYGATFLWGGIAGVAQFSLEAKTPSAAALFVAAGVICALSVWIIWYGYDIGRRYLPGKVLVTRTMVMSTLATTSQTDYHKALGVAAAHERSVIDKRPWWFYSYRRPPKKNWFR